MSVWAQFQDLCWRVICVSAGGCSGLVEPTARRLLPAPSSTVTPYNHLELVMTNPAPSHTLPSVEPKVELLKEQKSEGQEGEEHKTAPGAGLMPVQDSFPDASAWRKSAGAAQRRASMSWSLPASLRGLWGGRH